MDQLSITDRLRGQPPLYATSLDQLTEAAQIRQQGQAILLAPGVKILPDESDDGIAFTSATNAGKRGNYAHLKTYSQQESAERKWSPVKARIEANNVERARAHPENRTLMGWKWRGSDGGTRFVRPTSVHSGRRMEALGARKGSGVPNIVIRKFYGAHDSQRLAIAAQVPSETDDRSYKVVLQNLTSVRDIAKYGAWQNFRTDSDSPDKMWMGVTFGVNQPVPFSKHDVAAHAAYARHVASHHYIILQPFPMLSAEFVPLITNLREWTIKQDIDEQTNGVRHRHLNNFEVDALAMRLWVQYSNRATAWSTPPSRGGTPVIDYDWSLDPAPIKLKDRDRLW